MMMVDVLLHILAAIDEVQAVAELVEGFVDCCTCRQYTEQMAVD